MGHNAKTMPHIPEGLKQKGLPVYLLIFKQYMSLKLAGPQTPASVFSPSRMLFQRMPREQLMFVCVYLDDDWL